jgi:hypothetical protein
METREEVMIWGSSMMPSSISESSSDVWTVSGAPPFATAAIPATAVAPIAAALAVTPAIVPLLLSWFSFTAVAFSCSPVRSSMGS